MQTWFIYALLSAVFAALTAVTAKVGLRNINSDLATAVRTLIVLLITWALVLSRGKIQELNTLSKSNWLFLVLSAIATGASWICYYRALQLGNTAEVNAIDKSSIVFVVMLSFLFLKEPLTPRLLVGCGLIVGGMVIMVWK